MLEISLEGTTRIDSIGRRLRVATEKKMTELTDIMYEKVLENLSGKILNKVTGALAGSVQKQNDVNGDFYIGDVYISPADDKAWALEKGGRRRYPIEPSKAEVLRFISKSGELIFTKHVDHPPSKEFAYLRLALEDMRELVPQGFREYIQGVLDGGDYA